jgi:hypothetical protein
VAKANTRPPSYALIELCSSGEKDVTLGREPALLEKAIRAVAERAHDAYRLVAEASDAGLGDEAGLMIAAKSLQAELLRTKGGTEAGDIPMDPRCARCNRRVHWVSGVGPEPGHWAHAEPASDHEPVLD